MFPTLGLAAIYFLTAKMGLAIGTSNGFATLIWPPSGIALAALVLLGFRFWPGVVIGAFATNFTLGISPLLAFGIALGNTLQALVGAYLLRRIGFNTSLSRVK